jgi:tryptophan-rich sensory protein
VVAALGFTAAAFGAGALGMLAMRGKGNPRRSWFRRLRKPSFQPPTAVFAPIWTVLYGMMAYSGYRIWRQRDSEARANALGLWTAQLVLNAAWTPLFFGARRPILALADVLALDTAAAAYTTAAAKLDKPAAALTVPYLGWLGFATAINATIVTKNPSALLHS